MQDVTHIDLQQPVIKHSKLGVSSFILSLVLGLILLIAIVFAGALASQESEHEIGLLLVGLVIIGTIMGHLLGLIFGIIGCCQKNTKKVLSILGLIFNLIAVGFITLLMIVGMTMA